MSGQPDPMGTFFAYFVIAFVGLVGLGVFIASLIENPPPLP